MQKKHNFNINHIKKRKTNKENQSIFNSGEQLRKEVFITYLTQHI